MMMSRRRRTPRPLGEALRGAIESVEPATPLAAVQSAWAEAVGERIAAAASPVSERDGTVTVACESATWAQELDLLEGQIATKLRSKLPPDMRFERLRFQLGEIPR
ncbi:MAG: DciA family protein [Solirubrobacterales bacterium]